MSERKKYIHWGSASFRYSDCMKIKNQRGCLTKPRGGLWASPVDAEYGWHDWCSDENFRSYDEDNCFKFTLRKDARVLMIDGKDVLTDLPKYKDPDFSHNVWVSLDFEELVRQGYDAVEVSISDDPRLYMLLYGWDCDSILVMNPDVVEVCV